MRERERRKKIDTNILLQQVMYVLDIIVRVLVNCYR